jgi:hypothetical protein
MTVADDSDLVRGKSEWLVSGIQNYIIVAKGVILVKIHLINPDVSEEVELASLKWISKQMGNGLA